MKRKENAVSTQRHTPSGEGELNYDRVPCMWANRYARAKRAFPKATRGNDVRQAAADGGDGLRSPDQP
jgi:hypothetical protein